MPLLLGSLEPIASWSWRISNAIVGAYHVFVVAWLLLRAQHAPALQAGFRRGVACDISRWRRKYRPELLGRDGGWPAALIFAYLFGLIWLLAMALVNFVLIIFSTVQKNSG